jgi:hypothetical protein
MLCVLSYFGCVCRETCRVRGQKATIKVVKNSAFVGLII